MERFKKEPPKELAEIKDMRERRMAAVRDRMLRETEEGLRDLTAEDIDRAKEAARKRRAQKPDPMI